MRLVTKKDKSYYVYGMKDTSFYVKDTSLPMKYRFGHIRFDDKGMSSDEQKHYLYDHVFMALNGSDSYRQFKESWSRKAFRCRNMRMQAVYMASRSACPALTALKCSRALTFLAS